MLTDLKPLRTVTLSGVGDLRCTGLTLIVGPNSSGKTQLLRDIGQRMSGEPRQLVVAQTIKLDHPDVDELIGALVEAGYLGELPTYDRDVVLRPLTPFWGTGESFQPDIKIGQARDWHNDYVEKDESQLSNAGDQFLARIGKMLVSQLSVDRRLISVNTVGRQDVIHQPVQNEFQALLLDDEAHEALSNACLKAFTKGVWLDSTQNSLRILVCNQEMPSDKDRLSTKKMSDYRPIDQEGDGLKSFVTMATALLLQKRPVCLIDEPEMCLHPPQARELGRLIGKYGSNTDTATFGDP